MQDAELKERFPDLGRTSNRSESTGIAITCTKLPGAQYFCSGTALDSTDRPAFYLNPKDVFTYSPTASVD